MRDEEHRIQATLFRWAALESGNHPELQLLHAIPNGGHRHKAVASRLKAEGVEGGVPGIFLPVARAEFHGLYIEMKTPKGRLTESQRNWTEALTKQGYRVEISRAWDAAASLIANYLGFDARMPLYDNETRRNEQ